MAHIIDGKAIAAEVYDSLSVDIAALGSRGIVPGLAVVLVGENPASQVYVRQKEKKCEELGIRSFSHRLAATAREQEVLDLIAELNVNPQAHGILVQLPLPEQIDPERIIRAIDPGKDVDGFHPMNMGRLVLSESPFPPCTPAGCMVMLNSAGVDLKGKRAVVVGRSNIVGKPIAFMLLKEHATVTICHSRTVNLPSVTREADVLVAAVGKAGMIAGDMVKEGVVVIDVGINRTDEGKLVGDVLFDEVEPKAAAISPVPGGVGPMTIAMLMRNTVAAARMAAGTA